jgi:hypothetical protein
MARKSKDPVKSAAQLRVMMRSWRQRAWIGVGLALLSALGVAVCWRFHAHGFWWFLTIMGVVSALLGISGDISAYFDTKRRVVEIERSLKHMPPNDAQQRTAAMPRSLGG